MNCRIKRWSLLLALFVVMSSLASIPPSGAEMTGIAGRVYHIVTEEPVPHVLITVGDEQTVTDEQGFYALSLAAGTYTVSAQAAGYIGMSHALRNVDQGLTTVSFAMIPEHPDDEMNARIVEQLALSGQELSVEVLSQAQEDGFFPSAVTQLPDTIRLAVRSDPAVRDSEIIEVITLEFEDYIKGILPYEMSPSYPAEALKAQAVAARSYAAANMGKHAEHGADLCSSVHCQVWKPTHYATTDLAVNQTQGVAATYGGAIISAFYHGHCDGHTRNSEDVWSAALPYCRSVACSCGYTTLWGHGVGMCQEGARAMANAGATYDQIIKHYYTGVSLLSAPGGILSEGRVEPTSGGESTVYAFRVRYWSTSGTPPPVANVIIDGRAQTLVRDGGSAAEGWTYAYATRLSPGAHTYYFEFDDGYGRLARSPSSSALSGPSVSSESPAPPPSTGLQANITASTAQDWSAGQMDGTRVILAGKDVLTLADGQTQGTYTSPVLTPGATFVARGLIWYAETPGGSSVSLETRSSLDGNVWTAWQSEAGEVYVPGNTRLQSAELVFGEARYLQYRITLIGSAEAAPLVRNIRIACIDSRPGPQSTEFDEVAGAALVAPIIIARSQWGADESWMTWPPQYSPVKALVLHHTVTQDGGQDPAWVVRAIYRYHAIDRGWGDIGYNYLIDHYGRIYQGRYGGASVVGAHAFQYNWGSIGIGMIGNFEENPVPPALYDAVTSYLAFQCSARGFDPMGSTYLVDKWVPIIVAHRDLFPAGSEHPTACPGQYFYALMGNVRADTLAKMTAPPPSVSITSPTAAQKVRAVVTPLYTTSSHIARMSYYVDGTLVAQQSAPFTWKWNTTQYADGSHTLRVVVENTGGSAEASVTVTVDNTSPTGSASVPAWTNTSQIPITITGSNASRVAFSQGWQWEGEGLHHQTGALATDSSASQGYAWLGRAGIDGGGAWYGPYTCAFPPTGAYEVLYTLKTDQISQSTGLATLDVADSGRITYGLRAVSANDFCRNTYEEFAVPMAYTSAAPSCQDATGGVEFRTWYSGAGNLWLDRVRVFTAPVALGGVHTWNAPASDGVYPLTVRLVDDAGNATERQLSFGVDRTAPRWDSTYGSGYWASDRTSGMSLAQGAWQQSFDGGAIWTDWQPLTLYAPGSNKDSVLFYTTAPTGNRVRYRAVDVAGNVSVSPALTVGLPLPVLDVHVYLPLIGR
jgi:hypothetical protein